jgi:hypothetical protein
MSATRRRNNFNQEQSLPPVTPVAGVALMQSRKTSIQVFRQYISQSGSDDLDATGVISLSCFNEWVSVLSSKHRSQEEVPHNLERKFQRALSGHVTGIE